MPKSLKKIVTEKVDSKKGGSARRTPVVETIVIPEIPPITLKISASEENWLNLLMYLDSFIEAGKTGPYPFFRCIKEVCISNRIIGKGSGDRRTQLAHRRDEPRRLVAAVYAFVNYWKEGDRSPIWPPEYKNMITNQDGELKETILDHRYKQSGSIKMGYVIFRYCKEKMPEHFNCNQKDFETEYLYRDKKFHELAEREAERLFREYQRYPSIAEIFSVLPDPSVLNLKNS